MKKEGALTMQTQEQKADNLAKLIPIPEKEKKILRQAEINVDLWNEVEIIMKQKDMTIREAMEWGLRALVITHNKSAAIKLGLISNKK